jgi:hypothetical protein
MMESAQQLLTPLLEMVIRDDWEALLPNDRSACWNIKAIWVLCVTVIASSLHPFAGSTWERIQPGHVARSPDGGGSLTISEPQCSCIVQNLNNDKCWDI